MKQRLILLNGALFLAVAACGWVLRANWLEARSRERQILARHARGGAVPAYEAPAAPKPAQPASFVEVAMKTLFSKDRNPNVIEEPPPPPAPPPPVPPFPRAYGVMDLGDGPMIFIGLGGGKQRPQKVGDTVGPWKIAALNGDRVTLEWVEQKKTFEKSLEELKDRSGGGGDSGNQAAAAAPPDAVVVQVVKPIEAVGNKDGPGVSAGTQRLCNPGDTSPPGTVVDGYRKVVARTPFGDVCRWDPVQ